MSGWRIGKRRIGKWLAALIRHTRSAPAKKCPQKIGALDDRLLADLGITRAEALEIDQPRGRVGKGRKI